MVKEVERELDAVRDAALLSLRFRKLLLEAPDALHGAEQQLESSTHHLN